MKRTFLLLLTFMAVLCMGALTKPQMKMLNIPHWRVDANISGANIDLGTSDQTSYIGIENGSLTLTNASGNGVLTAQIPCSSTNSPSGTTCSAGNESVGVSFTIPSDGCVSSTACDVKACVSFGHLVTLNTSGIVDGAFQIVETASNAQTIIQEGKSRVPSGGQGNATAQFNSHRVCGTFTFTSAGQKTLRLFYEQDITATVTANIVAADASASGQGQRDIHWEVYPILAY